jgi:hypothetical protein
MIDSNSPRELGPCPVCGQVLGRPLTSCGTCHTPHHADCWSYNEGCAIYACGSKPAAPPPTSRLAPEAMLPRLAFLAMFISLGVLFAAGGRPAMVQLDDLSVEVASHAATATFMTTPRARCTVEIVRADAPDIVVSRRRTARSRHHRVELPGLKAGGLYIMRVSTQGTFREGQTFSQLFRTPDEKPAKVDPPPFAMETTPSVQLPLLPVTLESGRRDPFQHPAGVNVRLQTDKAPFSTFDLKMNATDGTITWRTRTPMTLCRVLISRDETLKGVWRVVDATSRGGTAHKVSLSGLEADTSYQALVLAFPAKGEPVQAPVVAFRTLAR